VDVRETAPAALLSNSPTYPAAALSFVFVPCSGIPPSPDRDSDAVVSAMMRAEFWMSFPVVESYRAAALSNDEFGPITAGLHMPSPRQKVVAEASVPLLKLAIGRSPSSRLVGITLRPCATRSSRNRLINFWRTQEQKTQPLKPKIKKST